MEESKISEVIDFMHRFSKDEYAINIGRLSPEESDEQHAKKVQQFFDDYYAIQFKLFKKGRYEARTELKRRGEGWLERARASFARRKVFMAVQYVHPQYGPGFSNLQPGEALFACYLGDEKKPWQSDYGKRAFVAEVDGSLKIIAEQYLDTASRNSVEWGEFFAQADGYEIPDPGEKVAVKKVEPPENEVHRKHYENR